MIGCNRCNVDFLPTLHNTKNQFQLHLCDACLKELADTDTEPAIVVDLDAPYPKRYTQHEKDRAEKYENYFRMKSWLQAMERAGE